MDANIFHPITINNNNILSYYYCIDKKDGKIIFMWTSIILEFSFHFLDIIQCLLFECIIYKSGFNKSQDLFVSCLVGHREK